MYGRYGVDRLTTVLLGITCGITLIGTIANNGIVLAISYIPLIIGIYRTLSKDIQKRSNENRKMLNWWNKVRAKWKGSKTHCYYKCPNCRQSIRVPKGKGNIIITCPKCRKEFNKRT